MFAQAAQERRTGVEPERSMDAVRVCHVASSTHKVALLRAVHWPHEAARRDDPYTICRCSSSNLRRRLGSGNNPVGSKPSASWSRNMRGFRTDTLLLSQLEPKWLRYQMTTVRGTLLKLAHST